MKYMLLFEKHSELNDFYRSTLDDKYWKEMGSKFPQYNNTDSDDCKNAVEFIYNSMVERYPNIKWDEISNDIKNKIRDGIT